MIKNKNTGIRKEDIVKEIFYIIWKEGKYYVAQCLNVDISSFGETIEEVKKNIKEAVELYFENENIGIQEIEDIMLCKEKINA